jgi:hypothetical protein
VSGSDLRAIVRVEDWIYATEGRQVVLATSFLAELTDLVDEEPDRAQDATERLVEALIAARVRTVEGLHPCQFLKRLLEAILPVEVSRKLLTCHVATVAEVRS